MVRTRTDASTDRKVQSQKNKPNNSYICTSSANKQFQVDEIGIVYLITSVLQSTRYFQTLQKWVWEICSSMFLWKGHFWAKWFSVYLAVAERKNISNVYFLSLEDDEDKLCWRTKHEIEMQVFFEGNNMLINLFAGANWQLTLKYLPWKLLCISLHLQIFLMSDPQKHRPQVGQVYHIS